MFQNGPLTIKLTCSASFFVKNESAIRKRHPLKGMDKNLISYTEAGGMHMKKIICLWLCLFVLCARTKPGSFEDGNIDMEKVIEEINEEIADGHWKMGLLQDEALSLQEVEKQYHMDMTQIKDCRVQQALIPAQLSEVALFLAKPQADTMLKKAIQEHKEDLKQRYAGILMDGNTLIDSALQGRIGQYYYFVLGEDAKKVVHYMQEIK